MKRLSLALVLMTLAFAVWAADAKLIGRIDYVEGSASITRAGQVIADPNIDDPLYSGDLVKTASDGRLVIALDKTTGMGGTINVNPKTSFYLKLDSVKGQQRTQIELLAGAIGQKVKKLAGSPTMQVLTGSTVAGVRGTEFEVAVSVNDSSMILCTEGEVTFSDGKEEVPVPAGKAVELRAGERLRFLPVQLSSIKQFREKWIADEISAFRADPVRALANYEKRYSSLSASFAAAFDPFQKSEVLKKWMDEDKAGLKVNSLDPTVLREKKTLIADLIKIRKILFIFERVYYRLDEISGLVAGTTMENQQLRPGLKVGDFLRKVRDESALLERRVGLFRYAEKLYEIRNEGGSGMLGSSNGDDFFGDDSDFFGSDDGF